MILQVYFSCSRVQSPQPFPRRTLADDRRVIKDDVICAAIKFARESCGIIDPSERADDTISVEREVAENRNATLHSMSSRSIAKKL